MASYNKVFIWKFARMWIRRSQIFKPGSLSVASVTMWPVSVSRWHCFLCHAYMSFLARVPRSGQTKWVLLRYLFELWREKEWSHLEWRWVYDMRVSSESTECNWLWLELVVYSVMSHSISSYKLLSYHSLSYELKISQLWVIQFQFMSHSVMS